MSGLIKSRDAADRVRAAPLSRPPAPAPPAQVVDVETLALRRELEALAKALRERDSEIELLKGDLDRAFDAGEAQGRTAGLREGEERRAASLELLRLGVGRALQQVSRDLESLERLAAQLALEGLSKLLVSSDRAELLTELIRKQVGELEARSIVRVEVANTDFGDPAALAALASNLGRPGLELAAIEELGSGDCRIKLVLGGLEVGIDQQWGRLEEALSDLAHPGGVR